MSETFYNKRIYVYSLTGIVTGGCELLHQLVGFLNDHGRDAYIVYEGFGLVGNKERVLEPYKKYNVKIASYVPDTNDTVVVLDEGFLYMASRFKNAKLLFWWLSVDNFFLDQIQMPFVSWCDMSLWGWRHLLHTIKVRLHYMKAKMTGEDGVSLPWYSIFSLRQLAKRDCISAYQSEYARLFLEKKGFRNLFPLSDYINTDFTRHQDFLPEKENIILYNPKKGYEYTQKLIAIAPSLRWIPLINMTREEVREAMQRAKVYIDFGNHPGKDRIPREAALNGCCVITGMCGSAGNTIDISIPRIFKFDEKRVRLNDVIEMIRNIFDDYEHYIELQKLYREKILKEKAVFESECRKLFHID